MKYHIYKKLALILAVIFLFVSCHGKHEHSDGYYTCSMHPQVIQKEPGTCPICQMELTFVPNEKKKNKDTDPNNHQHVKSEKSKKSDKVHTKNSPNLQFHLSTDLIQNANITTTPVKKTKFTHNAVYAGHIDYNESPNFLVIVNTKYEGWIERLYVSQEGQYVRRGQALLGIYSPKLLAAKEEYLTTFQTLRNLYKSQGKKIEELYKDPTLTATRKKLLYLDVPNKEIQLMEKNGRANRLTYFYAPISGIAIQKNVLQGQHIKPGQQLFQIANLYRLWIYIHIFEKDLPFIHKGNKVEIMTTAYGDQKFHGTVDMVYPFLRKKTRDIQVRITMNNPKLLLKPGMYVKVLSHTIYPGKVLIIPEISIVYSGERNYVFVSHGVKSGKGTFELRPISILSKSNGKAIVRSGLKENELIVTNGQFLLDSEASLKETTSKMSLNHQH